MEAKEGRRKSRWKNKTKQNKSLWCSSQILSLSFSITHNTHTQLISNCGKLKFCSLFFTLYLCIHYLCFTALQFALMAKYVFYHIDCMFECVFSLHGVINRHETSRHTRATGCFSVLSLFSHMSDSSGPKGMRPVWMRLGSNLELRVWCSWGQLEH